MVQAINISKAIQCFRGRRGKPLVSVWGCNITYLEESHEESWVFALANKDRSSGRLSPSPGCATESLLTHPILPFASHHLSYVHLRWEPTLTRQYNVQQNQSFSPKDPELLSYYKSTASHLNAEAHLHACSHLPRQPSGPETCRGVPGPLHPSAAPWEAWTWAGGSVSFSPSVQGPVSLYAQEAIIK